MNELLRNLLINFDKVDVLTLIVIIGGIVHYFNFKSIRRQVMNHLPTEIKELGKKIEKLDNRFEKLDDKVEKNYRELNDKIEKIIES